MKLSLLILCLLPMTASCSQPEGRWQSVVVTQQGETPCFGVPDRPDVRAKPLNMRYVSVSQKIDAGPAEVWYLKFIGRKPPVLLSPGGCLKLGSKLGGQAARKIALEPGRLYTVSMMGDLSDDPVSSSRHYEGRFCLARGPDGRNVVRQIADDARERVDEVCPR